MTKLETLNYRKMEKLILFVLIGLVLIWACYKMYFKVRFEYLLREMSKYQKRKLQVGKRVYLVIMCH